MEDHWAAFDFSRDGVLLDVGVGRRGSSIVRSYGSKRRVSSSSSSFSRMFGAAMAVGMMTMLFVGVCYCTSSLHYDRQPKTTTHSYGIVGMGITGVGSAIGSVNAPQTTPIMSTRYAGCNNKNAGMMGMVNGRDRLTAVRSGAEEKQHPKSPPPLSREKKQHPGSPPPFSRESSPSLSSLSSTPSTPSPPSPPQQQPLPTTTTTTNNGISSMHSSSMHSSSMHSSSSTSSSGIGIGIGDTRTRRRKVIGSSAIGVAVTGLIFAAQGSGLGVGLGSDAEAASMVEQVAQIQDENAAAAQAKSTAVVECLFSQCRGELFGCLADAVCAANLVCLSTCTGKPDEIDCQVRCGDLFQTSAIDKFNDCAISRGKCVPQRSDENLYPVPAPESLVSEFDMAKFTGPWFISLGQNDLFDVFDCQLHNFKFDTQSAMLEGDLQWRVSTPDTGFITRKAVQTFRQDPNEPALLINDGNDFLNYSDNWYIASSQLDGGPLDHVLVYYRGSNDAWDGYGGVVLYTRQPVMPKALTGRIKAACDRLPNVRYADLKPTNNLCQSEPALIQRLEKTTEKTEKILERAIEEEEELVLASIEERLLDLEGEIYKDQSVNSRISQEIVNDLAFFLKGVERDVQYEEKQLEGYAKKLGQAIVDSERKFVAQESSLLGKTVSKFFRFFSKEEKQILEAVDMDVKDIKDLLAKTFGGGASFATKRATTVTAVATAK